jgi:hypothetical protein
MKKPTVKARSRKDFAKRKGGSSDEAFCPDAACTAGGIEANEVERELLAVDRKFIATDPTPAEPRGHQAQAGMLW